MDEGISGALFVIEPLRQICIGGLYRFDDAGLRWWDYIKEFKYRCDQGVDGMFGSECCVKDAMQRSGIDYNPGRNKTDARTGSRYQYRIDAIG